MASLTDLVASRMTPEVMQKLAGLAGISSTNAKRAIDAIIPTQVMRPGVNEHHGGRRQPVTEKYSPAFRFGHGLATTEPFRSQSWETIEPDVRQLWEEKNPGT
jgi:hypothetical protein